MTLSLNKGDTVDLVYTGSPLLRNTSGGVRLSGPSRWVPLSTPGLTQDGDSLVLRVRALNGREYGRAVSQTNAGAILFDLCSFGVVDVLSPKGLEAYDVVNHLDWQPAELLAAWIAAMTKGQDPVLTQPKALGDHSEPEPKSP